MTELRMKLETTSRVYVMRQATRTVFVQSGDSLRVINEAVTGTINGSNATFTTAFDFIPESIEIKVNGIMQKLSDDYTTSGAHTIQFVSSPVSGDKILISYTKA